MSLVSKHIQLLRILVFRMKECVLKTKEISCEQRLEPLRPAKEERRLQDMVN